MKEWKIEVEKLTDERLLHIANGFTSGKESRQSLKSAYKALHTTIRTQIFLVKLYNIPQYVAYHFRTHFSLTPMAPEEYGWMRSKRTDKGGLDFRTECYDFGQRLDIVAENINKGISEKDADELTEVLNEMENEIKSFPDKFERYAPTNFAFTISAEGLMNMSAKRLCVGSVSKETREVMEDICEEVKKVDPDLYPYLVKPCIATGVCREKCCGFIRSELFTKSRNNYKRLFTNECK